MLAASARRARARRRLGLVFRVGIFLAVALQPASAEPLGKKGAERAAYEPPPPPSVDSLAGERLEFVIRWGGLPAGRATLEVESALEERLVLRATARSLPWLDWMYPVRESMESLVRLPGFWTERLTKTARARRVTRLEEVVFDRSAGTVSYRRDGIDREPIDAPADVRDALASFYAFRTLEIGDGSTHLRITDGKRVVDGDVEVLGRDRVKTPAGTFDTFKIEPRIEGVGGVFRKSPGARIFIWLTDDTNRRPVRVKTRVALGRVTAELTRHTVVAPGPTSEGPPG